MLQTCQVCSGFWGSCSLRRHTQEVRLHVPLRIGAGPRCLACALRSWIERERTDASDVSCVGFCRDCGPLLRMSRRNICLLALERQQVPPCASASVRVVCRACLYMYSLVLNVCGPSRGIGPCRTGLPVPTRGPWYPPTCGFVRYCLPFFLCVNFPGTVKLLPIHVFDVLIL